VRSLAVSTISSLEQVERHKHFLVIENDADDAFLIRRAFSLIPNCTSFVCRNTSEARAYVLGAGIYSQRDLFPIPHTIICDLRLQDESGVQFIDWHLKSEEQVRAPLVVLSGSASPAEIAQVATLGVDRILQKPNNFEALRTILSGIAEELFSKPN
jgi:two-component system, response regulator